MSALSRLAPWVSGLILIAGVVAFLVVKLGDNGFGTDKTAPPTSAVQSKPKPAAKSKSAVPTASPTSPGARTRQAAARFDADARGVAGKFILTAVQRKHLARAWPITGPALREGTTYKQWLTGNIAVIPFLPPIAAAKFSVRSADAKNADIGVAIIPKNSKIKAQFFNMQLVKLGRGAKSHWVVNDWSAQYKTAVPVAPGDQQ